MPGIIAAVVIIIVIFIFALFVYPKIIAGKHIDFLIKANDFLDSENISYKDSAVLYAEQRKSAAVSAAKFGKQLVLGLFGIQEYSGFAKYIIVYNTERIMIIPVCIGELSGNIILCEDDEETIQNIDVSDIHKIEVDENSDSFTFIFGKTKKTIIIPDKAVPYTEQTELKNNFIKFINKLCWIS